MKINIKNPTKAYVTGTKDEMDYLKELLTYRNNSAFFLYKKILDNKFWLRKDPDGWNGALKDAKAKIQGILVFNDEVGTYIRPGSIPYIKDLFTVEITNDIVYPKIKPIAWYKKLPFTLHEYQSESVKKLIEEKHANVSLTTGAGKSACLLQLCRDVGLPCAIVAPSKPIFEELLDKFQYHFGHDSIGTFGDGKKKLGKKITICIGDSLANVKEETPEWEFFNSLKMFAVDESHTWGADSLEAVCNGVFSNVPYRFFLSATQTRGDGTIELLQSIIGKTVYTLSTKQAVDGGFISPHDFRIVEVDSDDPDFYRKDPLAMKRVHFLKNRSICNFIAQLANAEATINKKQTLVLVEELEQISMLKDLLQVPFSVAHSEKKAERLEQLGLEKVKTSEQVKDFNSGKTMVLIGTSCISVGTNLFPHIVVNWVGGSSEIKTLQGAVGRAVRKHEQNPFQNRDCAYKDKATIYDFDVDVKAMKIPLVKRISFYKNSESTIKLITLKKF